MRYRTREDLQRIAILHPSHAGSPMTRSERLERWADVLECDPGRRLRTLVGTEHLDGEARDTMRNLRSPLSIAMEDPVLRAAGLTRDTYGEARRFFELTNGQLHDIVCYCRHGATIRAGEAARFVRAAIASPPRPGLLARLRAAIFR